MSSICPNISDRLIKLFFVWKIGIFHRSLSFSGRSWRPPECQHFFLQVLGRVVLVCLILLFICFTSIYSFWLLFVVSEFCRWQFPSFLCISFVLFYLSQPARLWNPIWVFISFVLQFIHFTLFHMYTYIQKDLYLVLSSKDCLSLTWGCGDRWYKVRDLFFKCFVLLICKLCHVSLVEPPSRIPRSGILSRTVQKKFQFIVEKLNFGVSVRKWETTRVQIKLNDTKLRERYV